MEDKEKLSINEVDEEVQEEGKDGENDEEKASVKINPIMSVRIHKMLPMI